MNSSLVLFRVRLEELERDLRTFAAKCEDADLVVKSLDALIFLRETIDAIRSEQYGVMVAESVEHLILSTQNSATHC